MVLSAKKLLIKLNQTKMNLFVFPSLIENPENKKIQDLQIPLYERFHFTQEHNEFQDTAIRLVQRPLMCSENAWLPEAVKIYCSVPQPFRNN
jgi:hypothetical protein